MTIPKFQCRQPGLLTAGLFLLGLAAGLAVDVVHDFIHPEHAWQAQARKLELALRANLELEGAQEALRECILRGPSGGLHRQDFARHLDGIYRDIFMYSSEGWFTQDEREALQELRGALPTYQRTIYRVLQLRAAQAPLGLIDQMVADDDSKVSAAFLELERTASDTRAVRTHVYRETGTALLCAGLAAALLALSFVLPGRPGAADPGSKAGSVQELSHRVMRWEEDKEARIFSVLRDKVCQPLSAAMYLLRSAQLHTTESGRAPFWSNLEPIVPSLQLAIRETLAIGQELHLPGPEESGLLETLDSLWTDCRSRRPALSIEARAQLGDEDVAETLKAGILRIARMTFDWASQEPGICRPQWDLERRQDQLRLAIRILGSGQVERFATPDPTCQAAAQPDLAGVIHAQVLLSGGTSGGARDIPRGRAIEAIWPLSSGPAGSL
jgi:hypothetical protein